MADVQVGIVGAGFAGLAAALMLRRHRRSVLVFDGGPPRNVRAAEVHGYLGAPGLSAAELRQRGCEQVIAVGAQVIDARIQEAIRQDSITLAAGDGRRWTVDRLLLATGVTDVYPDIDRFFDFYGRSVFTCPHCDGYEVRGRPVAVVSWGEQTLEFTLEMT
ncbi:MAG TPA: FAD-dependent oxidoreductase, partial [Dehalococcoidia bacterium]|nr:FAD-dependent oxidoreductase [Dehalococcoidia bacterium]